VRQHETRVGLQGGLERGAFHAAERRLAEHLENLGQRHAALMLDLAVELDERRVDRLAEQVAKRRLAAAAQPDQRDAVAPGLAGGTAEARQQDLARLLELGGRQTIEQLPEQ